MKALQLSEYFSCVVIKRLSEVEVNVAQSNQHELNGVAPFHELFGEHKRENIPVDLFYFDDYQDDTLRADGALTWYDAREKHPTRQEFRLYYTANEVLRNSRAGDLLLLGMRPDDSAIIIVARSGSTAESQVVSLFGLTQAELDAVGFSRDIAEREVTLDYVARAILEELGIEVDESDESFLDVLLENFADGFPGTQTFSAFARETLKDVAPEDDPDAAVIAWMDREEVLFKTLERHMVQERLREGFWEDVDAFLSFATSIRQRRSSRAGYALENHLKAVFDAFGVRYSHNAITENRSKPDFIFPGIREYSDEEFDQTLLMMLGSKRTCKDRWRQVLSEAARIPSKHLFTLEPGISVAQTDEMQANRLQLVVPKAVHRTYTEAQREWLINLRSFVDLVAVKQNSI
ncbi:MAG: type II restriction endonuclease [Verrucomicrobiota bacterium]